MRPRRQAPLRQPRGSRSLRHWLGQRGYRELFGLKTEPREPKKLANAAFGSRSRHPLHRSVLQPASATLLTWLSKPVSDHVRTQKNGTVREEFTPKDQYPLAEIAKSASKGKRGPFLAGRRVETFLKRSTLKGAASLIITRPPFHRRPPAP